MSFRKLTFKCSIHGPLRRGAMNRNRFKPVRLLKRGDCYQLYFRNPDGKLRRISGGNNLAIAQKTAVQFNDFLMAGKLPEVEIAIKSRKEASQNITLKDFFPTFRERHGNDQSESTQRIYRLLFRKI